MSSPRLGSTVRLRPTANQFLRGTWRSTLTALLYSMHKSFRLENQCALELGVVPLTLRDVFVTANLPFARSQVIGTAKDVCLNNCPGLCRSRYSAQTKVVQCLSQIIQCSRHRNRFKPQKKLQPHIFASTILPSFSPLIVNHCFRQPLNWT